MISFNESKEARKELDDLFKNSKHIFIIHYSCETFYDRKEIASPRITSIAIRNLHTGQTTSFSIHLIAEEHDCLSNIETDVDQFEKEMLEKYFDFVRTHLSHVWVHWNMRDSNYGFQAIEHRFKVLGGIPFLIGEEEKCDLSRLLIQIYGKKYIGHPRLESLINKNKISKKSFLAGSDEAASFENREYYKLHQSTLRKTDIFANIMQLARDNNLKTNLSWLQKNCSSVVVFTDWLKNYPLIILIGAFASIYGFMRILIDLYKLLVS